MEARHPKIDDGAEPVTRSVRAFVAVPIPERIQAELGVFQTKLKRTLEGVSWTRPESIHLTLHFLGNVETARLDELRLAFETAASTHAPFSLEIADAGSFGNRVIWTGARGDVEPLTQLADSIRAATASFGTNVEERAFKAHVTLGRLRTPQRGLSATLREFEKRRFGEWRVDRVHLYESRLSPHGATHTVLHTVPVRTK